MTQWVEVTDIFLVERLRAGERWSPQRWEGAALLKGGYCHIKGNDIFVQHTPKTVGISTSPAIVGAIEALEHYGNVWRKHDD